jgi:hypothetical protein
MPQGYEAALCPPPRYGGTMRGAIPTRWLVSME